jgi:hypothetical protein
MVRLHASADAAVISSKGLHGLQLMLMLWGRHGVRLAVQLLIGTSPSYLGLCVHCPCHQARRAGYYLGRATLLPRSRGFRGGGWSRTRYGMRSWALPRLVDRYVIQLLCCLGLPGLRSMWPCHCSPVEETEPHWLDLGS